MKISEPGLLALAEAAGYRHDIEMQQTIHELFFSPDKHDLEDIARLAEDFDIEAKTAGHLVNPFMPSPPPHVLAIPGLRIGTLPGYDEPVNVPVYGHKYVAGQSGSGKTTLVEMLILQAWRAGLQIIVFDPEGQIGPEIGGEIPDDQVHHIDVGSFMVNPFDPPARMAQRDWIGEMANVNREAFFFRQGSDNLFMRIALQMCDSGKSLDLRSFYAALMDARPKGRSFREHDHFETLRSRFEVLLIRLPSLTSTKSPGLSEMFSRPVVIFDWQQHKNATDRKYITMHALSWLLASREDNLNKPIDTIVVCDEVSKLASIELKNDNDIGEPFFIQAIRTSRKRGISFITLDQDPSKTHPVVRANSQTHIVMHLREGRDKDTIARDFDLNPEQRMYLSALRKHHDALVLLPDWPQPFLVQIPEIHHVNSDPRTEPGAAPAA